jgi:hypothetical protein
LADYSVLILTLQLSFELCDKNIVQLGWMIIRTVQILYGERETLFGSAKFLWGSAGSFGGFLLWGQIKMECYSKLEEGHAQLHVPPLVVAF